MTPKKQMARATALGVAMLSALGLCVPRSAGRLYRDAFESSMAGATATGAGSIDFSKRSQSSSPTSSWIGTFSKPAAGAIIVGPNDRYRRGHLLPRHHGSRVDFWTWP